MTLAVFLLSASFLLWAPPTPAAQPQAQSAESAVDAKAKQDQGNAEQNQPSPPAKSEPASASPAQENKAPAPGVNPKRPARSKRNTTAANCDGGTTGGAGSGTPTPASSAKASSSNAGGPTPTSSANTVKPTSPGPANCPPTKVIVRQGGTSEPSIQLAGGAADSPDRDSANQMLLSAEQNLKKISGQPLSSSQQEIVGQVRQFVNQSKAASAVGDLERARTLAWKAQTLSEELLPPQK